MNLLKLLLQLNGGHGSNQEVTKQPSEEEKPLLEDGLPKEVTTNGGDNGFSCHKAEEVTANNVKNVFL